MTLPAPRPRRRRRRALLATLLTLALLPFLCCTSTGIPPPPPPDPTTIFLLHEALHTGIVLPAPPGDPSGYVEFSFGDWNWYALGNEHWYNAFATVLWPTQGTLGRREFGSPTADALRARVTWAELSPLVVSAAKANALRQKLQADFDARRAELVERRALLFQFVPSPDTYWCLHNCADVAATWLLDLDCTTAWAPIRTGLQVAKH